MLCQITRIFAIAAIIVCVSPLCGNDANTEPPTVKIPIGRLKPGPVRHETLTANQLARIATLQRTLAEVDSDPLAKWIDDFRRDVDPERELAIWEAVAKAYSQYCAGKLLSVDAKQDVIKILLLRAEVPEDEAVRQLNTAVFSVEQARGIMRLYSLPAKPIQVYEKK